MIPSQKGWTNQYINLLIRQINSQENLNINIEQLASDKKLYTILQPSGLMYGHPIRPSLKFPLNMSSWDNSEKMKVILFDGLINQALLANESKFNSRYDVSDCLNDSISEIIQFYRNGLLNGGRSTSFKTDLRKNNHDQLESMINDRLLVKSGWGNNFWAGFFQNSLLFLDVFYFGQWFQSKGFTNNSDLISEQQEVLRLNILQIIAAAAHSNNIIEDEEKALFKFFLQSAKLNSENERIAKDYLNHGIAIKDIHFNNNDPWIVRKYILELAILTIWADKKIEEDEREFIQLLSCKLGFDDEELESSLLSIESFVISNWDQVHFLQKRHDIFIIKDRFTQRIGNIVNKNKKALLQEIQESKELFGLLMKMTKEDLSITEKSIVKTQLLDLIKTLPTFVIIALPGTFITLPLLLKLLPKEAFPSAFSEME